MSFENNNAKFGYIGVAGTAITGYYANNLFLEANNSLIFNSGGQQTGNIPRMIINNDGNIGIGTSNPGTNQLYVNGTTFLNNNTTINGTCTATTFSGSGASLTSVPYASITGLPATFPPTMTNIYSKTESDTLLNAKEATLTFNSPLTRTTNTIGLNQSLIDFNNLLNKPDMNLYFLKSGGTITGNTNINGIANIHNGSPVAVPTNYMASGSLTIGGTNVNYGGGTNWNANTAGLLMECADNTEIAVHDANLRVASFMYYEGGANNRITIGKRYGME